MITITEENTADCNTKTVKIVLPLRHLSSFWRTLEIL